ncbi:hypothetical protein EYF80_055969 [Liparis tanakae]|uniref:Uncharacterized protein n=1 Tax=Liparis tanakae TaxID=230148 RepID=A0A4Z2EYD0_9TELE|nr:hypothetical protein EYF80_055969 [Liparis tanakae]
MQVQPAEDLKAERAEEAPSNLDEYGSEEFRNSDDARGVPPLKQDAELGLVFFPSASSSGFVPLQ